MARKKILNRFQNKIDWQGKKPSQNVVDQLGFNADPDPDQDPAI
jgi:hypothetical protein